MLLFFSNINNTNNNLDVEGPQNKKLFSIQTPFQKSTLWFVILTEKVEFVCPIYWKYGVRKMLNTKSSENRQFLTTHFMTTFNTGEQTDGRMIEKWVD